jgi:two-component system cell cycle sensor histidine kinase/response regulator CckA
MTAPLASTQSVILVVDDEPFVLNTVCCILAHSGYQVLRAATPEEALRIGTGRNERIDLILCDVVLPGLSGSDLAERLVELHPEMLRLFMAGLPSHPEVADRILGRGLSFLAKPFVPDTLLRKVRETLGGLTMAAHS